MDINTTEVSKHHDILKKPEEIRKEIDVLTNLIKNAKCDITYIQSKCKHDVRIIKKIKYFSNDSLMIVCTTCDKTMGYPTGQDLADNGYVR